MNVMQTTYSTYWRKNKKAKTGDPAMATLVKLKSDLDQQIKIWEGLRYKDTSTSERKQRSTQAKLMEEATKQLQLTNNNPPTTIVTKRTEPSASKDDINNKNNSVSAEATSNIGDDMTPLTVSTEERTVSQIQKERTPNASNDDITTNSGLLFYKYIPFSQDETDLTRITDKTMSVIDFNNEEVATDIRPELREEVIGTLNPVTTNTIKYAATVLFKADCETQNARNTLELFEIPSYIPSCIRLSPPLQRKKEFRKESCQEYQQLAREFKTLNESYIQPAKAIMLKDKRLVLRQAQHSSKRKLLEQLLRVTQSVCSATVEPRLTMAMLRINDPIPEGPIRNTDSADEGKALTIGFAYLLLFVKRPSKVLMMYMGEDTQMSMLNRVSNFLMNPKPIIAKTTTETGGNIEPFDLKKCVRIGNLTFKRPNNKVWMNALSIAESLEETVIHITMEQRQSYILQQNRSRALQAVHECGIRQEHIANATTLKSIIEHSTLEESKVLTEANSWRKKIYDNLVKYCNNKMKTLSHRITNKILPKPNSGLPDAAVAGAKRTVRIQLPPAPPTQRPPPVDETITIPDNNNNNNKRKNENKQNNKNKKLKQMKATADAAVTAAAAKVEEAKVLTLAASKARAAVAAAKLFSEINPAPTSASKQRKKKRNNKNKNKNNSNKNSSTIDDPKN
jgi:hypothetical protein